MGQGQHEYIIETTQQDFSSHPSLKHKKFHLKYAQFQVINVY